MIAPGRNNLGKNMSYNRNEVPSALVVISEKYHLDIDHNIFELILHQKIKIRI